MKQGVRVQLPSVKREQLATPVKHLKLVEVPTYGRAVLPNASKLDRLLVRMHVGFVQPGAQIVGITRGGQPHAQSLNPRSCRERNDW